MIRRAIAAALLVGLGLPALAAPFVSPAYDQAADLAAGKNQSAAVYDGNTAQGTVQTQVTGALATGGLAVQEPAAAAAPDRPTLTADPIVPSPATHPPHAKFFSVRSLLFGTGGAAVGAGAGWFLGGPLGAAIGALAGFAIGFFLSKLLH